MKTKIGLIGARGRMGQAFIRLVNSDFHERATVAVAITSDSSADDIAKLATVDVIVDVSGPEACAAHLSALKKSPPVVVGSTGWSDEERRVLDEYGKRAAVLVAPNFSPTVNLFLHMLETYAPRFKEWGYESALFDAHHNQKRDAPSGTAKALLQKLEAAGHTTQVNHIRAGNIVGTHSVSFVGPEDIFEIRHEALNRDLFARGAVLAALWMAQPSREPGKRYSMNDVFFS